MKIIEGSGKKEYVYNEEYIVTKGWQFQSNSVYWICYDCFGNPIMCRERDLKEKE